MDPWMVTNFAFFSNEYKTLYYGDDLYLEKSNLPMLRPRLKKFEYNPNTDFIQSTTFRDEWLSMIALPRAPRSRPRFSLVADVSI